jgi:energy-coupling factor transport system ATP-binding protein
MIEFRSVSYQYPDGPVALNDVSMQIEDGSCVAILGQNGAGKTTFVKCMNGLLRPTSGDVIVNGVNTKNETVATLAKTVGLVFQNSDNQLFAPSVREELAFSLNNIGIPLNERESMISTTLELLDLEELAGKSPFLLSGGEKKRCAFASLICMNPSILVADEPTQGQDEIQKRNIESIFKRMLDDGKTVIIVSHDLDFISHLATRIIIFHDGKILIDGSVDDVLKKPDFLETEHLMPTEELELKWMARKAFGKENVTMSIDQEALVEKIVSALTE